MNITEIDNRIQSIMLKMEKLKEKSFKYSCGIFPPQWNPPLSETVIKEYENQNEIKLPNDYKRFITTIAASGTQPFYGLYSPCQTLPKYVPNPVVSEKFPYTVRKPLELFKLSEQEYESINIDSGFITLCTEGDGMCSILIVNTDDQETYGTVWYYDVANDAGLFPLINPKTKRILNFLDWLEYYADKTYELSYDDYFGYAQLAGKLEGELNE